VVVQAGLRSGARNAAKTARRIGRPIFAVPSCPWVHQGLGCNLEISLGARPISSAKDVVKWLAVSGLCVGDTVPSRDDEARSVSDIPPPSGVSVPSSAAVSTTLPESLEGELLRVLDELRKGARNVDEICQRTGWPAAVVQSDVLRLTLYGEIKVGRSGVIEIVSG
jgi:DNA processing protein